MLPKYLLGVTEKATENLRTVGASTEIRSEKFENTSLMTRHPRVSLDSPRFDACVST